MLYNQFQSEIEVSKEELEEIWNNSELDTKGVVHALRKLIKEKTGYEYTQELIRGIFNAENYVFRLRKARKVYPVVITEEGKKKRIHNLVYSSSIRGENAHYECIETKSIIN